MRNFGTTLFKVSLGVGIGIGLLFIQDLFKKEPIPPEGQVELQEDEIAHIVMSRNTVTTVKKGAPTATKFVPRSGRVRTTVTKSGVVKVRVKNKGLSFSPGFGVMVADRPRLSLDLQLWYWNRASVLLGGGFAKRPTVVGFIAASYSLDRIKLNNTAIYVGIATSKNPVVGLRWAF